ncbi:conserved hypothetical protein [Ricinus communis]|uniref:Uncharacterized protein n=1 Tax=Ricinus communis TaxID=3988 RepID=B9RVG2_RICCO|nr:conserved hypothetical protein [Ricinus communis]
MVLGISVSFVILLGRPWFHALGIVLSVLQQMVKFQHEGKVLAIKATEAGVRVINNIKEYVLTGFEVAMLELEEGKDEKEELEKAAAKILLA